MTLFEYGVKNQCFQWGKNISLHIMSCINKNLMISAFRYINDLILVRISLIVMLLTPCTITNCTIFTRVASTPRKFSAVCSLTLLLQEVTSYAFSFRKRARWQSDPKHPMHAFMLIGTTPLLTISGFDIIDISS